MLYKPDRTSSFFITKYFLNCYVGDINHPEVTDKIFLLYEYRLALDFLKFETKLELMSEHNTDWDYSSERVVMFVMDIPEERKADYKHFLNGEYTQFSEEYKRDIVDFWKEWKGSNLVYNAVYGVTEEGKLPEADEDFADGEVFPKPVLTRETYMTRN